MSYIKSITIVSSDYPALGHPAYVFVQQLVHAMINQNISVSVVAYQSIVHSIFHREKLMPKHSRVLTESGIEYDVFRPYTLSFGNSKFLKGFSEWYNKKKILSKIKQIGSDVIYSHFWQSALPVYEFGLENKIPLFVACGEGDNALEDMVKCMSKEELYRLKESVYGVISVSSENKRKCENFGLSSSENVEVFPNCVNTEEFHKMDVSRMKDKLGIKEDDFVICFVGVFTPRKGPDRVAQAINDLNDDHIKVMFIGKPFKGYDYDFDCPGIIHKGPLDHALLPEYVNCADVFVLPTQKEGCCNAIVEALAMGIPVISSEGAFNDDILDDKNSIRVNPDDVTAIRDAIKKLKDNKELRQSMSEYSLSRHDEYSIRGRASRILSFIEKQISLKNNEIQLVGK